MSYTIPAQSFDGRPIYFDVDFVKINDGVLGSLTAFDRIILHNVYIAGFQFGSSYNLYKILASDDPNSAIVYNTLRTKLTYTYTYDGKTVYYYGDSPTFSSDHLYDTNGVEIDIPTNTRWEYIPGPQETRRIAWLMVYGGYTGYSVTYDLSGCVGDVDNPTTIPLNATITNFQFDLNSGYAFNSGSCWIDGDGYPSGTPIEFNFNTETGLLKVGPVTSDIAIHIHSYIDPYNDPNNPDLIGGDDDIPGGDMISIPSLPGVGVVSSGMIGLFNPTVSQMQLLADYMWTDFGGTGSTTEDILKEIVQAIKRSISNPLDYVIGLNIIPSQGLSVGSSTSVRFGFVNSNVSMPRLTSQYFTVDCGSLSFDKLCGDTFLDYAPYSKFSLYLPYIGVKEVDANDFVGHTISILYHGDVVTGGVTAYILKDGSVMYQYSGCCALTVPLNADSWGTTISGAIQIATAIIGGATLSSAGKGFAAKRAGVMAATGAANIASNPSLLSPQVMRSGAISGGAGCMASQKPFVIREAARFHTTEGFNTISGYPSYYYKPLSTMHGFTSVLDAHLHGIPGTHQELAEIEDLLKEGIIL